MVFHKSLRDSKSSRVSRTFLSILADLNNALVWMVSTFPLISKFSSPITNPLGIVPRAPITFGITFMFHSFLFSSLARYRYSSLFFSLSFIFNLWSARTAKSTVWQVLSHFFFFFFFFFTVTRSGYLAEIRRSVCISKSQRNL